LGYWLRGQEALTGQRSNARILDNRRLAPRGDRLGFIGQTPHQAACIFLVAGRVTRGS
jgi:hypothetical protein